MAKKPKTRAQKAAAKRHARFKKTRVQTFGGTKKSYTARELKKIDDAGFSRSTYTGGAVKDKPAIRQIDPTQFDSRGQQVSAFGSPVNMVKSLLNIVPGVNMRLATNAEIRASQQNKPTLTRPKSRGGSSRIEQQAAATDMSPYTAEPIGTQQQPINYIQGGTDNSQLTRIQQQSYQDNLSRMMGNFGTTSTAAAGGSTQTPSAPQIGSFRGIRRFNMFAPKSSYMAQGSGSQNLLNRSGLRITSLNT
tara:strand:- start:44 stop:787 length:744 start_codon:yes stop_codon:yes gene_type:complete